MNNSAQISIIVPIHNESESLELFSSRLISVMNKLKRSYEIICINDGSKDDSYEKLLQIHHQNHCFKIINFSRNFGKEVALTAGIDYANGAAVIPIDADLQDPPELIEKLIAKWEEGYDVVYATRRSRKGESWLKKTSAKAFYYIFSKLNKVDIPADTGDFRLIDRKVIDALKKMPEKSRFMKGLFSWVGYKQTFILFDRDPRYLGKTSWNYWQLWNFALDGIFSFSSLPLRIWSYVGIIISFLSLLYASFLIVRTLLLGIDVPGYASIMVAVLFMGGIQLITLGVLGEYLSRVYEEAKARPLYLVREEIGFNLNVETYTK